MGPVCGHGARRYAPLGVRGGSSWACREAQAGACPLFSSCSRSSSRRPGLLPHEPGPGTGLFFETHSGASFVCGLHP